MVKTGLVEAIDSLVPLDEHLATFRGTDIQEQDQKESQNQTKPSTEWKGQSQRLTPQLHESAGGLPSLKLSLHSCSLPGSTNAMGIETSIALVLPAREHECDTSFVLRRPPALS
ncbi:hypothetical protein Tco_0800962 [Tanacetum coccineum]|uniref:Uncharacterized protein n=1 Tax=Tanacetum coccineum TaxID=301880 RepID=A0ABQ4ZUM3_9ASTR